jgi:shikimate kinase
MTTFPDPVQSKQSTNSTGTSFSSSENRMQATSGKVEHYLVDYPLKGTIITLTGIVAAGKSSITHAVRTIDPSFHEEDLDLRRDPTSPTTEEIEMQMIDDTIDRSLQGGGTVISLMDPDKLKKRAIERGILDLPVKTLLLHCPFSEIPARLRARNNAAISASGDPKNYRNPVVPLEQFAELYAHHETGIETIDRNQAINFFNSSFDEMIAHEKKMNNPLPPDEQIATDKMQFCKDFLALLGFVNESQTQIRVSPKKEYDLVIDTSTCRDLASRVQLLSRLIQNKIITKTTLLDKKIEKM